VEQELLSADMNISFIGRWYSFIDPWQRWNCSET